MPIKRKVLIGVWVLLNVCLVMPFVVFAGLMWWSDQTPGRVAYRRARIGMTDEEVMRVLPAGIEAAMPDNGGWLGHGKNWGGIMDGTHDPGVPSACDVLYWWPRPDDKNEHDHEQRGPRLLLKSKATGEVVASYRHWTDGTEHVEVGYDSAGRVTDKVLMRPIQTGSFLTSIRDWLVRHRLW